MRTGTRMTLMMVLVLGLGCLSGMCLVQAVETKPENNNCEIWQKTMNNAKNICRENKKLGHRCTSQSGQDVVLNATFDYLGVTNKQCVEFGFGYGNQAMLNDLTVSTLAEGTRIFSGLNVQGLMRNGFKATFFDAELSAPHVGLVKSVLTRKTIGDSFRAAGIPVDVDYVSIDVDSIDVWLLLGMFESGFRPRVLSVEYNCNFAFDEHITCVEEWSKYDGTIVFGASAGAINFVASKYGYTLVHIEQLLDLFFVRNDILKDKDCVVPSAETFYEGHRVRHHKRARPEVAAKRLVEFHLAYEGKLEEAHKEAMQIVRSAPNRTNNPNFVLLRES